MPCSGQSVLSEMSKHARTLRMSADVRLIAHRGARAFAPENTLEAIDKTASAGADAVERASTIRFCSSGECIEPSSFASSPE